MAVVATEPTDQEVDEWAEREKKRREAWLTGPGDAEKREWRRRQQHVRELREFYGADEADYELERALERRLRRDVMLAGTGIFDILVNWPHRLGAKLIRTGLDRQYDYYTEPAFRRRVPPDFAADE
jgi:hypothetical protein